MARTKQTARKEISGKAPRKSHSSLRGVKIITDKDLKIPNNVNKITTEELLISDTILESKTIISRKPKTKITSKPLPKEKVTKTPSIFDKMSILELNKYLLENGVPVPSKGSGAKGNVVKKDLIALAINIKEQTFCNVSTTSTCSTTTSIGCSKVTKGKLSQSKVKKIVQDPITPKESAIPKTFQTLLVWSRNDREDKRPTTILISETIPGLNKKMFDYIIANEPEDCWDGDYATKQEFINVVSKLKVDDNFSPEFDSVYVVELIRDTEI